MNPIAIAGAATIVVVAIIILAAKAKKAHAAGKELSRQQSVLKEELKIAEAKLLKHQIDEKTFQELVDNNQKQLVEIEARLASGQQQKQGQKEYDLGNISTKSKHVLEELLKKKDEIKKAISIAERKFFKRQINSATYKEILESKQTELVKLEAEIKKLYADETVKQIKKDLVEKLKGLDGNEPQDIDKYAEEVFTDISAQQRDEDDGKSNGEEQAQPRHNRRSRRH